MTSIIFFKFNKNLWWAFTQMGIHKDFLKSIDGQKFYKMLGTGSDPGFSMYPDFYTYALLQVWESSSQFEKFFQSNKYLETFLSKSTQHRIILLSNFRSTGFWDGINPFLNSTLTESYNVSDKIAVITRGTINFNKLIHFWLSIKKSSEAISSAKGVSFFKGIGELPFIQQATFSIWDSEKHINSFAYSNIDHKEIINKTRRQKWYKEDLFARFHIIKDSGFISR